MSFKKDSLVHPHILHKGLAHQQGLILKIVIETKNPLNPILADIKRLGVTHGHAKSKYLHISEFINDFPDLLIALDIIELFYLLYFILGQTLPNDQTADFLSFEVDVLLHSGVQIELEILVLEMAFINQVIKDHSRELGNQTRAVFHYKFKFHQTLGLLVLIAQNLLSFLISNEDVVYHGELLELAKNSEPSVFFGGKFIVKIVPEENAVGQRGKVLNSVQLVDVSDLIMSNIEHLQGGAVRRQADEVLY